MEPVMIRVEKQIFDLKSFEEVPVVKEASFTPAESVEAALTTLGNSNDRLLAVINKGLQSELKRTLKNDPDGWHTYDDEGAVNGEFDGQPADVKKVNSLVLTLAKTVYGFTKDMPIEAKRAAKENAIKMIKETEAIRAGLAKSAAIEETDED